MSSEKQLPANVDCERAILGAVLLENSAYFQAAVLDPEAFSLDSHRRIFLRMSELAQRGEAIDFNTLTEELGKHKEIETVGGVAYVTSVTDGLPRVKNIGQYVKIVQDKAMLRNLIHSCNRNSAAAYDQQESAQSLVARTLDDLLGLQAGGTEDPKKLSEFSEGVIETLKRAWSEPGSINRYTLGLPGMTEKVGGLISEEYAVLMGRTGDGKTGYATQIALENGLKGKPVLIFPLELSKEVMLRRIICQLSRVSNRVIIKHTYEPTAAEIQRITHAKKILDECPIYFDDSRKLNVTQFRAKARQWLRRHAPNGDGLIITDYMQKFVSKYRDMRDKMTEVSEAHRQLALDEKTRVLGLSQMGRPEGKNMNARPTIFDPKESGSIENDAHILISAYRPVDEHKMKTHEDELIVCKNRDGGSAIEEVTYRGEVYTFVPRQAQA